MHFKFFDARYTHVDDQIKDFMSIDISDTNFIRL